MELKVHTCKRRFDRELKHIKLILVQCRKQLSVNEWLTLVEHTRMAILKAPEEFFCHELPPYETLAKAIDQVFEGFLIDQRLILRQKNINFSLPSEKKKKHLKKNL